MDLTVILLLALPVLLLAAGFLLALRTVSRSRASGRREHTADGQEILWSEPFARLARDPERPPGPGNLMLTPSGLRFERYLSRAAHEVPWSEVSGVSVRSGERGEEVVFQRGAGGEAGETAVRVRDARALVRALERLGLGTDPAAS